jgi:hypothetical protein
MSEIGEATPGGVLSRNSLKEIALSALSEGI